MDISPTIDNLTIDAGSSLTIANTQALTVANSGAGTGTITNSGTITLDSTGSFTSLEASGIVSLTGGGTVSMSNAGGNLIDQATSNSTLTNVNNSIQGSGEIGRNGLSLNNQSVIDANQPSTLLIDAPAVTNTGTLEATGGGTLEISNSAVSNTNGTISTDGSSSVILSNSGIGGGNLTSTGTPTSAGTGEIHGQGDSLNGVTITSGSTYSVDPGQYNYLTGDLTNNGTVVIGNSSQGGSLFVNASTVNLSGGGTVILNNASSYLRGSASTDTLVNKDNTIQGQGIVTGLNFTNQGIVDANVPGGTGAVALHPETLTANTGTLEATGGGTLYFLGSTVTNTNATISTDGSSSSVILNGSGIIGGNLTSTNGAVIQAVANSALGGVTITSGSTLSIEPGVNFNLVGDLTNDGTVEVGGNLIAYIQSAVNLSGSGTVTLNGGALQGNILVNKGNTIQGQGTISVLNFTNEGTVDANVSGGTLNINRQLNLTTNTGTLEATGGGTLDILERDCYQY